MTVSTIWVLQIQALIAWCFCVKVGAKRGHSYEDFRLDKSDEAEATSAEGSTASAASMWLQPRPLTNPDRGVRNAFVVDPTAAPAAKRLDYASLREQVEYYLSDENLRRDKFFHGKISADADGWLELALLLGCHKIQEMNATLEEISVALKDSKLLEVKEGGAFVRRFGNAPLPALEIKPHQTMSSTHKHDGGIISVFKHIPTELNWSMVRNALNVALPPAATLWFCSKVDDKQRSFCATSPFEGDEEFFEGLTLVVGGAHLKPELCQGELLNTGLKLMPRFVRNRRMYEVLHFQVARASRAVERLEGSWAPGEITKRIAKYIFNSAQQMGLRSMKYEAACDQLVKFAMVGYEAAFGGKSWFFHLDLGPSFAAVAWELLRGEDDLIFQQVQARTRAAFEAYLDSLMLSKGIRLASINTFNDPAIHTKVFEAARKAHRLAFAAAMNEASPGHELDRVQEFMRRWIKESVTIAWNSTPNPETVLTVRSVSKLFQNMLAPFGLQDPFSTIPSKFTERIGAPPRNWAFVNEEVKTLFDSWGGDTDRVNS